MFQITIMVFASTGPLCNPCAGLGLGGEDF